MSDLGSLGSLSDGEGLQILRKRIEVTIAEAQLSEHDAALYREFWQPWLEAIERDGLWTVFLRFNVNHISVHQLVGRALSSLDRRRSSNPGNDLETAIDALCELREWFVLMGDMMPNAHQVAPVTSEAAQHLEDALRDTAAGVPSPMLQITRLTGGAPPLSTLEAEFHGRLAGLVEVLGRCAGSFRPVYYATRMRPDDLRCGPIALRAASRVFAVARHFAGCRGIHWSDESPKSQHVSVIVRWHGPDLSDESRGPTRRGRKGRPRMIDLLNHVHESERIEILEKCTYQRAIAASVVGDVEAGFALNGLGKNVERIADFCVRYAEGHWLRAAEEGTSAENCDS